MNNDYDEFREGQYPQGQRPQAQRAQGQSPQGQRQQAQRPQGQYPQGQRPQGQRQQPQRAQGQYPQGQRQQARRTQGQYPQGQRPQGQYPQGQRQQGQYPQGQRQQGQRQQPQRTQGQYPQGQRAGGQYTRTQRSQWQHPQGESAYGTAQRAGQYNGAPRRTSPARHNAKKNKRSVFRARLLLTLALFLVLGAVIFIIARCAFYSTPDDDSASMTMTYGKESFKVDESVAYRGGELYISFTKLADYLKLTVTGDADSVRYVFASDDKSAEGDGEEYAEFFRGDTKAVLSGSEIVLSSQVYFSGDEVFVPASFVKLYMDGLDLEVDTSKHTVKIARTLTEETDEDGEQIEAAATLKIKAQEPPAPLDPDSADQAPPPVEFTSDLTAYEQYMAPADDSDYLTLVSKEHPAEAELVPTDLIGVDKTTQDGRAIQQMRECAAKALEAMFIEMEAAGYADVSVASAYRSYENQKEQYDLYVMQETWAGATEDEAKATVDTYFESAGTSEHQTGLCCNLQILWTDDEAFAGQPVYGWLKENAWKFGFIERYSSGKEDVTGHFAEPTHYRFVGRRAASQIKALGITLEEFLDGNQQLQQQQQPQEPQQPQRPPDPNQTQPDQPPT